MASENIAGESYICINRADIEREDEKEVDAKGRIHVRRGDAGKRVKFMVMRD